MKVFRRSQRDSPASSGFTLIELLVATTILAGLLAITYSGMRIALTMWEKSNERAQSAEQLRTVLELLRDQVSAAMPLLYLDDGEPGRQRVGFEGRPDRLRFVSAISWRDGNRAAPRWIELSWNGRLAIDERRILSPSNVPAPNSDWHLDLTTFEDFQLHYIARAEANALPEKIEVWDIARQRELPAAVSVNYKANGVEGSLVIPLDYAPSNWRGFLVQ
jgi:general secretion pathway protein J